MDHRDWQFIDTSKPQWASTRPVTMLAASARLGMLVTCFKRHGFVYALDETVDGGVSFRFAFDSTADIATDIIDIVFTDSPEADEPPLLLVAYAHKAMLDVIDVSGLAPVRVGLVPIPCFVLNSSFRLQARGRTLGIAADTCTTIRIYEGHGSAWVLKHILGWGNFLSKCFCMDNDNGDVVVARRVVEGGAEVFPGRLFVVDRDGHTLAQSALLRGIAVRSIIPCEDE